MKWYKCKGYLSTEATRIVFETRNELGIAELNSTKSVKLICKRAVELNRELTQIKSELKLFLEETTNFIQERLPEGSYYRSEYIEKLLKMLEVNENIYSETKMLNS